MKQRLGVLLTLLLSILLLTSAQAEQLPTDYAIMDVVDNSPAFAYQVLYARPISADTVEVLVLAHAQDEAWDITQNSFVLADTTDTTYTADVLNTPGDVYIREYALTIPAGESQVLSFHIPFAATDAQTLHFVCQDADGTATAFSYEPVDPLSGTTVTADMLALFQAADELASSVVIIGGADGPTEIFLTQPEPQP